MAHEPDPAAPLVDLLRQAQATRHPILYLHGADEARVLTALTALADERGLPVATWACTDDAGDASGERGPLPALRAAARESRPGYHVFKDIAPFLDRPPVQRALRDAYYALRERDDVRIVLLDPLLVLPEHLRHAVQVVTVPPPAPGELRALAAEMLGDRLPDAIAHERVALALSGLTLDTARHVLHAVAAGTATDDDALLDAVHAAKQTLAAGAAVLEFVFPDRGLDAIGGLSNMKRWIDTRAHLFTPRAVAAGEPVPRGVLLTGVSGCGKSLFAKVVARVWNVPLFRLDMNLIFSGAHGNPEAAFHLALSTVESLAPAVLWIDEIENGLGFVDDGAGDAGQLFSAFLTWMQEKPPLVFVAATANRIEFLPPEMLRKGRFDQVFFVDLPDTTERAELFTIHLQRQAADPTVFDVAALVRESDGWSGAEIEQAVLAARAEGLHAGDPFTQEDMLASLRDNVPLSRTMNEKIKALRDWAWGRAVPASAGRGAYDVNLAEEEA